MSDWRQCDALKSVAAFRRKTLQDLLDQCPEAQKRVFELMYRTRNAADLSEDKLDWATFQCENGLKAAKNATDPVF